MTEIKNYCKFCGKEISESKIFCNAKCMGKGGRRSKNVSNQTKYDAHIETEKLINQMK